MTSSRPDAGSFRDRSGRVFLLDERVYRTVMPVAAADFEFVRSTGLIDALIAEGRLIQETIADREVLGEVGRKARYVLEHPRLPYVSYPYEWPFAALKAAALLQLDIHLAALKRGVTLSDASAYNVQFRGARPLFIDALSFRRYVEGDYWTAHRQFCDQFLNPLLLRALLGVPHNAWYRGSLEGITAEEMSALLPLRRKLSWNVFTHVALQARLQRGTQRDDKALARAQARKLPLIGFQQILRGMRNWIARLEPKVSGKTVWADYAREHSYEDEDERRKRQFVAEFVAARKPQMLFDLGCNTGDYSKLALDSGAGYVVGFDFDQHAVQAAFRQSSAERLEFLPLILDATNPSPDQGWAEAERAGFTRRSPADAVIALALIHHLAIAKNVPMDQVIAWIVAMAPQGVIEFVQKSDPMVQRLLQLREDVFDDYDQETFERLLAGRASIVKSVEVSTRGRRLYWYRRD